MGTRLNASAVQCSLSRPYGFIAVEHKAEALIRVADSKELDFLSFSNLFKESVKKR